MVGDPTVSPDIARSALIHAFCTIDAGLPGSPTTRIGERTFLQARVHVGHNAVVGDDVELCAGVVICGHVQIGDGVRIGGNAWVKPRVRIGAGAIIGGGAVVTRDVPAHEVWAGNPAKYLKNAYTHPSELIKEFIQAVGHRVFPSNEERIEAMGYGGNEWKARELAREAAMAGIPADKIPGLSRGLGYKVDGDHA
jgi:carbonic anhydrase/acetyltransferase-like protein (isoleucine patch superfamily)